MVDLRYRRGRLLALRTLVPANLDEDREGLVTKLLAEKDEIGLVELLKGLDLSEKARRKLRLIEHAREVSLKLNEYSRTIPLPHRKIEEGYKVLRRVTDEFTWLGEGD